MEDAVKFLTSERRSLDLWQGARVEFSLQRASRHIIMPREETTYQGMQGDVAVNVP